MTSPWNIVRHGQADTALRLRIRVTPGSSRQAIGKTVETPDGPAIKASIRAAPENGAANKALIARVAEWLSVPKSSISLSAGAKSRTKVLIIIAPEAELQCITAKLTQHTQNQDDTP